MSQEKVNRYKESKKNRKQEVEKQKKAQKIRSIVTWVVMIVIVGALAFGIGLTVKNSLTGGNEEDPYKTNEYELQDLINIEGTTAEETTEAE